MPLALSIEKAEGKPGKVYYPAAGKCSLKLTEVPKPKPGPNEVLVRLHAAALNHRDFFIRQHLYPGVSFTAPLLADGYGTVAELGPGCRRADLLHRGVILMPSRGWDDEPDGPADWRAATTLGGSQATPLGTAQDYVAVHEDEVELAPAHLSPAEAAALPLVGLTGWRAFATKSRNALPGRNVLITGIGGGVALQVLQFAVARGCNVYVTSGNQDKIDRARALGAKGGVIYKDSAWDKKLLALLPRDRPYLDAVIDGAGGDIVARSARLLKAGGVISIYGMTVSPKMEWSMSAVLKNIELRGTTMGSRAEFREMVDFVREKKIRPVVSRVVKGLDNLKDIDGLFEEMRDGKQFGKLVIDISAPESAKL